MPSCPTCGAPLPAGNPGVVMAVCEYCGGVSYWNEQGAQDSGKKSMLGQGFTRLYRDATGSLRGRRFRVEGRVRYSFGRGFWDEWYITFDDGSSAWVTEDDHELSLQTAYDGSQVQTEGLQPGGALQVGGQQYVVMEMGEASCLGIEGQLPKAVLPDESYRYIDASSPDGRYALGIELDEEPPTLFIGEWLAHEEVQLDDEGAAA